MIGWKHVIIFGLLIMPLVNASPFIAFSAAISPSIELEQFRWSRFPLKVFVETSEWSRAEYVDAVRESLDSWLKGIWNYTNTFNDTSLERLNYIFYVRDVNSSSNYDVVISFSADEMPPGSDTVGLTTYTFDLSTHQPIAPISINVTTFNATAKKLFVKNVAMHEFGHALGLGHAAMMSTLNGPELMYFASTRDRAIYPSTLDVYGLTQVYAGKYGQTVHLPSAFPYVMLADGDIPPVIIDPWEEYKRYLPLAFALVLAFVAAIVLSQLRGKREPEDLTPPPPAPDGVQLIERGQERSHQLSFSFRGEIAIFQTSCVHGY